MAGDKMSSAKPDSDWMSADDVSDRLPEVTVRDKGPPWWRSQRYILAYFLFGGMMNIFIQRVNLSIAIICMVNHTAISHHHNILNASSSNISSSHSSSGQTDTSHTHNFLTMATSLVNNSKHYDDFQQYDMLTSQNSTNESIYNQGNYSVNVNKLKTGFHAENLSLAATLLTPNNDGRTKFWNSSHLDCGAETCRPDQSLDLQKMEDGPLVWDKEMQGLLLGAIYWTYSLLQIPANLLVRAVSKKTIVVCSMSLMSLMTLLMHVAAICSPWAVFVLKLVQGACTALAVIGIYGMWAKWAPPDERASLITLSMSGQNLGNIIVFPLSGLLCKYGFLGGWPSIFYVFGSLGFVWIILFFFFADESPSTHRFITEQERAYITSALFQGSPTQGLKVPWASIMRSLPFWGIVLGLFSFTWGLLLMLSTLPQYMYEVLKFDIRSNGVFTMLPYIALLIVTQVAGVVSDGVIRRHILSVLSTRRLCVLISNLVPAVLLTAMSFLDHTQAGLAITLLVAAVGVSGFALSGFLVNPYDIAPRFATEMMIIINTVATIPGVVSTYVVAAVTTDQTREQWQMVYFLTAGIYVMGALCFCLLGRAHVQPWALGQDLANSFPKPESGSDKETITTTTATEKELMLADH